MASNNLLFNFSKREIIFEMGGTSTKVSFYKGYYLRLFSSKIILLKFLNCMFKAKKNETKAAFKKWNTDGDKFLTFKEFDGGMQSLGITQERFLYSVTIRYAILTFNMLQHRLCNIAHK